MPVQYIFKTNLSYLPAIFLKLKYTIRFFCGKPHFFRLKILKLLYKKAPFRMPFPLNAFKSSLLLTKLPYLHPVFRKGCPKLLHKKEGLLSVPVDADGIRLYGDFLSADCLNLSL